MMGYSINVRIHLTLKGDELRGWFASEVVAGDIVLRRIEGR
jgi:hypothetical protein